MAIFSLKSIFGDETSRELSRLKPYVKKINDFEPVIVKLSDEELKAKTQEFKERLAKNETLEDILPEAFAVVREASHRTLGQRHFDSQLIGVSI